jgi:hypothetical protein
MSVQRGDARNGRFLIADAPAAGLGRLRARFSGHVHDRHQTGACK